MHVILKHDLRAIAEMLEPHDDRERGDKRREGPGEIGDHLGMRRAEHRPKGKDEQWHQHEKPRARQFHRPEVMHTGLGRAKADSALAVSQVTHGWPLR